MRRLIHFTIQKTGKVLLMGALELALVAGPAWAESSRIVVLNGQELKPYQEVIAGLQQALTKQGNLVHVEVHSIQGNPTQMNEALAHRLKSSSAQLGALATAAHCKDLETLGRLSQLERAEDLLLQLALAHAAACAVMIAELQARAGR